jgi:pilus assembly protein CpaC
VLLRVRFAEVSRNALTELGASFFANGFHDFFGRVGTQQFGPSLPSFQDGRMVFSDFLNLFLFDSANNLGLVIKALETKGVFQSLAEPNLVSESGKEASFLAGGEFPIPVAQGSGANLAISVVFKEFGIRLSFTPTVNGDRVHLKVKPEVSTLDFGNAVVTNGFRIPALTTRKTETELELQNGQTFAIAGLMNNSVANTMQKIPGIGDIPILGMLFRSKAAQKNQTELVVMITPEILPINSRGVTDRMPRTPEPYLPPMPAERMHETPAPAFTPARPTSVSAPTQQSSKGDKAAGASVAAATSSAPASPTPAQSVATSQSAAAPSATVNSKQMEKERQAAEKAAREEAKRAAAEAEKERERLEKEAREQLKREREQEKRDKEAAKRAEEEAKKQSQVQDDPQDDPSAKLKLAEAAYLAELAKSSAQN